MVLSPFFLFIGCSAYEGTWLLELIVTKSDNQDQMGQSDQLTAEITALADGNYAMSLGGTQLIGSIAGNTFSFERKLGNTYSGPQCDEYVEETSVEISGSFTADLGLDGDVVSKQTASVKDCTIAQESESKLEYSLTGLKLNVNPDLHTSGGLTWGYNSGGSYF